MITVVTMADQAYAMPLAVMVRSLLDNLGSVRRARIVVVDGGIEEREKERLRDSWKGSGGWSRAVVEFVAPDYAAARKLPVWGRVPVLTYSRISLDRYVGEQSSRAVLVDSDTLVVADVGALYEEELDGKTVGAARDPYIPTVAAVDGLRNYRELGLDPETRYFNAGVMVADLEQWRRERVTARAFAFIERYWRTLNQYDQDSLNAVLAGRWKEVDRRWQVQPRSCWALGGETSEAWLYHFSGRLKPWTYPGGTQADAVYYDYVDRTAWRGWRPEKSWRALALRLYDSPPRRLLHPVEKRVLALWRRLQERRLEPLEPGG